MFRFLRPFLRGVTYTRQLHLWVPALPFTVWVFVYPAAPWAPALVVVPMGLVPAVRRLEGVQARLLLTSGEPEPGISQEPSATWRDRRRTALWLAVRLVLGAVATIVTVWLPLLCVSLIQVSVGSVPGGVPILEDAPHHWAYALLAPLPLIAFGAGVVGLGELITAAARRLLGPSPAERMAALEAWTEQLLERKIGRAHV